MGEMVDEIYRLMAQFEASLLEGSLEEALARLAARLEEEAHTQPRAGLLEAAEKARLLAGYARALRVRIMSLRSKRGLSRARDEILRGLNYIDILIRSESRGHTSWPSFRKQA